MTDGSKSQNFKSPRRFYKRINSRSFDQLELLGEKKKIESPKPFSK